MLTKNNIDFVVVHMDSYGRYHDWCVRMKDGHFRSWFRTCRKGVSMMDSILPEELPKSVQNFIVKAKNLPQIQTFFYGSHMECVIKWE